MQVKCTIIAAPLKNISSEGSSMNFPCYLLAGFATRSAEFAVWKMTPTCFCVLGVYFLCAFSFSLFHRCSNNKSPQRWRSRIKQQIVLLGNGFHVFFACSVLKIASKAVWVKLWKAKAWIRECPRIVFANTSCEHKAGLTQKRKSTTWR